MWDDVSTALVCRRSQAGVLLLGPAINVRPTELKADVGLAQYPYNSQRLRKS